MRASARRRLPCALILAAFVVSQVGFFLTVPAFRGIDEVDHAFRASSVGLGHWAASEDEATNGRGYLLKVNVSVAAAAHDACEALEYMGPDNCHPVGEADGRGQVVIASAAGTYNPAWYAAVGTVGRTFEGESALNAMRITGILLVDLVLLAALVLARGARHARWMLAGVAIVFSPVLAYSSIVAAPNGLMYASGILLWISLLRLAETDDPGRIPVFGAAVGAALMMLTHSTGVMFVALVVGSATPLLWPQRRALWGQQRRPLLIAVGVVTFVAILSVAWIVTAGTNDPRSDDDFGSMPASTVVSGPVLWFLQSIATLAFRNEAAPPLAYACGAIALLMVILGGMLWGSGRQRLSMAIVVSTAIVVPLALTWLTFNNQGTAWQGRYSLPLTVGVTLVGAQVLGDVSARRDLRPILGLVLPLSVIAHAVTVGGMLRSFDSSVSAGQVILLAGGGLVAAALLAAAFLTFGPDEQDPVDV